MKLVHLLVIAFLLTAVHAYVSTDPYITYTAITGSSDGSLSVHQPTSLNPSYNPNVGTVCTGQNVIVTPSTDPEWVFLGGYTGTPPIVIDPNAFSSLVNLRDGSGRPWCWPPGVYTHPAACDIRQVYAGSFSVDPGYCDYLASIGALSGTCSYNPDAYVCTCSAYASVIGTGTVNVYLNGALISSQNMPGGSINVPLNSPGTNTITTSMQMTTIGYITGAIGVVLASPQFPTSLSESKTYNVISSPNGPNLVLVSASALPNPVTSNQQVSIQITLQNSGDMDAYVNSITISSSPGGFSGTLTPVDGNPVITQGAQKIFIGTFTAPNVNAQTTFLITGTISYMSNVVNPCTGQYITPPALSVGLVNTVVNPQPLLPDLTGSITFSDNSPIVGETVTVTATTSNIGQGNAGPSTSRYTDPTGTVGISIGALNPGASQPSQFSFTCTAPGANTFTLAEDVNNQITETNKNNNFQSVTLTCNPPPNAPDLIPTIAFSNSTPLVGQPVTVTITTRNSGNAAAGASVTRTTTPSSQFDTNIGPLATGGSQAFSFTYTCAQGGPATFTATANLNNQVQEENNNDGDNVATGTIQCFVPAQLPDLVGTITFSNNAPQVGQTILATITTTNIGNTPAGSSVTTLADPQGTTTQNINPLNPTNSQSFQIPFTCTASGNVLFTSTVNANRQVIESNYNNNIATATLACGQAPGPTLPDLVGTITFSNNAPNIGDTVTVTITTSNIGKDEANGSVTRVNDPDGSKDFSIGSLNVGSSQPVTLQFTCTANGPIQFTSNVNVDRRVTESNVNNNIATATLQCGGSGSKLPDLYVSGISTTPLTPFANSQTNITYTIANNGSSPADPSIATLTIDNNTVDTKSVFILASGASQDLVYQWPAINVTQGLHQVCAKANAAFPQVIESNYNNNILCTNIFIAAGGESCSILANTNPGSNFANLTISYQGLGNILPDWSNITLDCGSIGVGYASYPPCNGTGAGQCFASCGPYPTSPNSNTYSISATIFGRIFCSVKTACTVKV